MKTDSRQALAVAFLFACQPGALAHDSGGGGGGGGNSEHGGSSGGAEHGGGGNWHGSGGSFSHGSGGGSSHGGGWHGGGSNWHGGDHGHYGRHFHGGGFLGYPYDDWDDGYGYGYQDPFYFPPGPSYTQAYRVQEAGSLAAAVQQGLARAGYYRGPVDGEIGPTTRKAIGRYQSSHGLPVSRRIDEPLLRSLRLL